VTRLQIRTDAGGLDEGNAIELRDASVGACVVVPAAAYSGPGIDGGSIPGSGAAGALLSFGVEALRHSSVFGSDARHEDHACQRNVVV